MDKKQPSGSECITQTRNEEESGQQSRSFSKDEGGGGHQNKSSKIVLFCDPRHAQGMAQAFKSEISDAAGALPMRVISTGYTSKRLLGCLILEWFGPVTTEMLHNLNIDEDILDYFISTCSAEEE